MARYEKPHRTCSIRRRRAGVSARWSLSLAVWLSVFVLIEAGHAASPVAPGDVLRVSVLEAPELGREAVVDADGRIMLPQVGSVAVAGFDLDGARERVEAAIAEHGIVRVPTVLIEIAAYRPFYVGGAVAGPGAVPFSPGLTVRHAIILAGGIDRTRGPDRLSATDLLELRAKWEGNAFALVQAEIGIARLRAELDGLRTPKFPSVDGSEASAADAQAILELNTGLFEDRLKQFGSSREHLKAGLDLADLEIDVLEQQALLERSEQDIQTDQVERTRILLAKGLVPAVRLQELERQKSQISRDLLDNQAFAARARQSKESIRYELDVADANRRIDLRNDLASAIAERSKLEAESGVLASALLAAGIAITAPESTEAPDPEATIHRIVDGKEMVVTATMQTAVEPGDVVQVAIARKPPR